MTLSELHEKLEARGKAIMADIRGDREANGEEPLDYGFECYIAEVPVSLRDDFGADVAGVIYAGELGVWTFLPDLEGGPALDDVFLDHDEEALLFPHVFGRGGVYER